MSNEKQNQDSYKSDFEQDGIPVDITLLLNKDSSRLATPMIAGQSQKLDQMIKDFAYEKTNISGIPKEIVEQTNNFDWLIKYKNKTYGFYTDKKWVYECLREPEYIGNNIYKIYLSSDIFIRKNVNSYVNEYNEEIIYEYLKLTSRTIQQHIKKFDIKDLNYNISEQYEKQNFYWILRWLPVSKCELEFYTDKNIENKQKLYTPSTTILYNKDMEFIEVPFFMNKSLYKKTPIIKHDSPILYVRIKYL